MSAKIMIRVAIAALRTSLILKIAFVFLARRSRKQSGIWVEGIDEAKRTKAKNFIVERREGEIFCERE